MQKVLGADLADGRDEEKVTNWQAAGALLDFVYIKIGEGLAKDPLFDKQWLAAEGFIRRGAFHFFRPSYDPKRSAQKTFEYFNGHYGEIETILDLEVTDGISDTLSRAKVWLDEFERLTGKKAGIYSSPSFLQSLGAGRKTIYGSYKNGWLADHPLWLAVWYYDEIGDILRAQKIAAILKEELPINFPAAPEPWKAVTYFQWTSRGLPEQIPGYGGITKSIDLDFYNGDRDSFQAKYPMQPKQVEIPPVVVQPPVVPPPAQEDEVLYGGAVIQKHIQTVLSVNGKSIPIEYYLRIIDAKSVMPSFSVFRGYLQKTTDALRKSTADFAINGGGFYTYIKRNKPITALKSEGQLYFQDGKFSLVRPKNKWVSINYPNILIENGIIFRRPSRVELDPRTAFGWNREQSLYYVLIVDGRREDSDGLTLDQTAQLLLEAGAYTAIGMDSGASTTLAERDSQGQVSLVNRPCETDEPDGQRRVANHILFQVVK